MRRIIVWKCRIIRDKHHSSHFWSSETKPDLFRIMFACLKKKNCKDNIWQIKWLKRLNFRSYQSLTRLDWTFLFFSVRKIIIHILLTLLSNHRQELAAVGEHNYWVKLGKIDNWRRKIYQKFITGKFFKNQWYNTSNAYHVYRQNVFQMSQFN